MKKTLLFLIVFLIGIFSSVAQNKNRERIKMLKVTFISNALDLTPNEAEKFWPIYNKYDAEIKALKTQFERVGITNPEGADSISDEKAKELLSYFHNNQIEVLKSKKNLYEELMSVISAKRILKLQMAEGNFNRRMLQEFGKRRRMNMNNN